MLKSFPAESHIKTSALRMPLLRSEWEESGGREHLCDSISYTMKLRWIFQKSKGRRSISGSTNTGKFREEVKLAAHEI
jgi:hypothetical protein